MKIKTGTIIKCVICGKEKYCTKTELDRGAKTCSRSCARKGLRPYYKRRKGLKKEGYHININLS